MCFVLGFSPKRGPVGTIEIFVDHKEVRGSRDS